MPPNDNIFDNPAPESEANSESSSGSEEQSGLTIEQVQQMIDPIRSDLSQTQQALAASEATNTALQTQINNIHSGPGTLTAEPDPSPDEFVDKFTSDPKGTVAQIADEAFQDRFKRISPFLESQMNTIHQTIVSAEKNKVDSEYGIGIWDTHFAPVFNARVADTQRTNATALAKPDWVQNEVFNIMGLKRNELATLKTENVQKVKQAEEVELQKVLDRFNAGGMTGGTAPVPKIGAKELSPEEQAYISSRRTAGLDTDIQAVRSSRQTGKTLADWRKAEEARKAANS